MTQRRIGVRQLLVLGALALLLAPPAVQAGGEAGQTTPTAPEQEKSESFRGGCGGGCCARAAEPSEASGCGRAGAGGCCRGMGRQGGGGPRHGAAGRGPGHGGARRGPGHGGPPAVMRTAQALVHDYRHEIERKVEELDNGVVTITRAPESDEAAEAIRRHVREMKQLLEEGGRVRMWDPLFREIFDHAEAISMEIEELDDGMRVTETSDDPQVVALIQAHAHKVSEFIERGPAAVHEETPLPEGYAAGR